MADTLRHDKRERDRERECVCVRVRVCVFLCMCVRVCVRACVYPCMRASTYTHTNIHSIHALKGTHQPCDLEGAAVVCWRSAMHKPCTCRHSPLHSAELRANVRACGCDAACSLCSLRAHTHTHTYTHTHNYSQLHTRTHTRTRAHAHTNLHKLTHSHKMHDSRNKGHASAYRQLIIHVHMYMYIHMYEDAWGVLGARYQKQRTHECPEAIGGRHGMMCRGRQRHLSPAPFAPTCLRQRQPPFRVEG